MSDGYIVSEILTNKSNKTIKPFAVMISTLKKLVTSAYASLIFCGARRRNSHSVV